MIADAEPFVVTGIVVTEVLQGITRDLDRIEKYLESWEILEPGGFATYRRAAEIFRMARRRGFTCTTIDALIAAIALEHNASVFTVDKDFIGIARVSRLVLYEPPAL